MGKNKKRALNAKRTKPKTNGDCPTTCPSAPSARAPEKDSARWNTLMLEYVRMVVSFIEARSVSQTEIVQMLQRVLRQHTMVHRRKIDHAVTWLHEKSSLRVDRMAKDVELSSLDLRFEGYRMKMRLSKSGFWLRLPNAASRSCYMEVEAVQVGLFFTLIHKPIAKNDPHHFLSGLQRVGFFPKNAHLTAALIDGSPRTATSST